MLYSILVGILFYHAILAIAGVITSTTVLDIIIIIFEALCFTVAFFAHRKKNKLVFRISMAVGLSAFILLPALWLLNPVMPARIRITFLAIMVGTLVYIVTRSLVFRTYLYKDFGGKKPAPPVKIKWYRRVLAFVL